MPDKEEVEMQPCGQEEVIKTIQADQAEFNRQQNKILNNQETLVQELKNSFQRLENILLDGVKHEKDIEQLQKDRDYLFEKARGLSSRMDSMERTKALYDGANVIENVRENTRWREQEKGWRRFIPAVMAFLSWVATMIAVISKLQGGP